MADQSTVFRVRAEVENLEGLNRLRTAVRGVDNEAKAANNDFSRLIASIQSLDGAAVKSINSLQGQRNAFDALRRSVVIGSDEFKKATAEIARLDQQLAKAEGRQGAGGGRFGRLAQTVGAAASGGVFGGFEGLAGGVIGGITGGPTGALAGAAIGAQVGQIRQAIGAVASYTAEIKKLQIALAGVSKTQDDYEQNLRSITSLSKQFLLPLKDTTQQYTKLQASIQGAGYSSRETEKVFKGISAAIIATGGSSEDLNSALRATAQVFSKGKVSAEELRQQIGERLPGAFTIFASAIGKTPQELDKALENGQVSLSQFIKFAEELFARYGKTADVIADAPENAGRRLTLALDNLSIQLGRFVGPIGATFQAIATSIVDGLTPAFEAFANLLDLPKTAAKERLPQIQRQIKQISEEIKTYQLGEAIPGGRTVFTIPRQIAEIRLKQLKGEQEVIKQTLQAVGAGVGQKPAVVSTIEQDAQKKAKIPVQRISDIIGDAEKEAELAAKNLRLQELIAQAKQKNYQYDEQILPLLGRALQYNTEIQAAENAMADLIDNKNKLLKNGLSIEEYVARVTVARMDIDTAQTNRQAYFNELISQELDISKRINDAREKDLQKATQQVQDLAAKYGLISKREKEIIDNARMLAELEPLKEIIKDPKILELLDRLISKFKESKAEADNFGKSFSQGFASAIEQMGNLADNLGAAFGNVFMGMADQLAEFVSTGKASFADFARSALNDLTKIFVRAAFFSGLQAILPGNVFSSLFPKFAMGGIMTPDGPMPLKRYAAGGVANSPQLAMFGEGRQPEAYVPLPDGRSIPVTMQGGGQGVNVVVNVDAAGSSVQGDGPNAKALGVAISSAVKAEILKQQRPGGYLAGTR